MVEQTLEPTTTKAIAFTCMSNNGVTIWGYQTAHADGVDDVFFNSQATTADGLYYDLQGRRQPSDNNRHGIVFVRKAGAIRKVMR